MTWNKKNGLLAILISLLWLGPLAGRLTAQIKSATISGSVKDTTGASVPGVQITIINQSTNTTTTTVSSESGGYSVPFLESGTYTIKAEKSGFEPFKEVGLTVGGTESARADITLAVGSLATQVTVNADAAQLQTETVAISGSVNAIAIQAIPNVTQNALYYATLQPGVSGTSTMQNTQSHDSFGIGYQSHANFSSLSVNGSESYGSDIQLDGVPILGSGYNEASVLPNPEGLQEVRVLTNTATAEYGRGAGVITMITKNGTNQFHGSGYYRIRNEALNANSFSNNFQNVSRPAFKAHYYGGSVGGPVIKDKLFFFASYEGLYHKTGAQWFLTVPTDEERVGNFTDTKTIDNAAQTVGVVVYDPFSITPSGNGNYQRRALVGADANHGPDLRNYPGLSQYGLKLYSYYPEPTSAGVGVYHQNNFYAVKSETFKKNSVNARIDYKLNEKNSLYGSIGLFQGSINIPRPFGTTFYQSPQDGGSQHDKDKNPYGSIGDTIVLNPTTVIDVRYGIARIQTDSASDSVNFDYASVGIPGNIAALSPQAGAPVDFGPDNTNASLSSLGHTEYSNKITRETAHNLVGNVSKSLNRLTLKVGAEYRVALGNFADPYVSSMKLDPSAGNYAASTVNATGSSPNNLSNVQKGYGPANVLLGAGSFTTDGGSLVKPAVAAKYFSIFSQNDWHPTSRLTVNLGLRWELQLAPTERHNRISAFDAKVANPLGGQGAIAFPGVNGYDRGLWDTHYTDFGPRLGASYLVNPGLVARGGFGIVYVPTNTGYYNGPAFLGTLPFSSFENADVYGSNPNGKPVGTYDTGLTTQVVSPAGPDRAAAANYGDFGFNRTYFDRHNYFDGRAYQWNFFLEQKTRGGWIIDLGYVGSHGQHLQDAPRKINGLQTVNYQAYHDEAIHNHDAVATQNSDGSFSYSLYRPDQEQVANPFQNPGFVNSFGLANATVQRFVAEEPYPLFPLGYILSSRGKSDYHGLQVTAQHSFANGFLFQANYVWSKSLDSSARAIANNGVTDGSQFYVGVQEDLSNDHANRKYSFSDKPQRFNATTLYQLPFGRNRRFTTSNRLLEIAGGGWNIGAVVQLQSGTPLRIGVDNQYGALYTGDSAAGNGSINERPDRNLNVPIELPKSYQHAYDGNTTVVLPDGNKVRPCANCYLKYNPDAFTGRTVTTRDGHVVPDVYWKGNASIDYGDVRGPGRANVDANLTKQFALSERTALEITANFTNLFNHTEFTANSNGIVTGATNTDTRNLVGVGQQTGAQGTGSHGLSTYDPRQVQLQARYTF